MLLAYLIIAEKPVAAKKIAMALDKNARPKKFKESKSREYFEVKTFDTGELAVIVSAVGHLYTLEKKTRGGTYPFFDFTWKPSKRSYAYINTIKQVVRKYSFSRYIVATDFDLEGSVIGYNIVRFLCRGKSKSLKNIVASANRLRYSTLTSRELRDAWKNRFLKLDCERVDAGYTRHFVDIAFGLNLSRALMDSLKKAGKGFKVLSIGRVQGPTLKEVLNRDISIKNHVPKQYWVLDTLALINGQEISLQSVPAKYNEKKIAQDTQLSCQGEEGLIVKVTVRNRKKKAPPPFNLASLQREANKYLGISPSITLKLAEKLYLEAYISYPRTESEIIPDSVDHVKILKDLRKISIYSSKIANILSSSNLVPARGSKKDDAHPPILPTGNYPMKGKLSNKEQKLLDLIIARFLSLFGKDFIWEEKNHNILVNDYNFHCKTSRVLNQGWIEYYPYFSKTKYDGGKGFKEKDLVIIKKIEIIDKQTQPPSHYSDISLLNFMERKVIGTKSTRAAIIDKLKRREYITSNPIEITGLGKKIIAIFEEYLPEIIDVELTRELEFEISGIMKKTINSSNVKQKTIELIRNATKTIHAHEFEIGEKLADEIKAKRKTRKKLGLCPACKKGELVLVRKKNGSRFVACEHLFDKQCTIVLPIIKTGRIYATKKKCKVCGFPIVKRYVKGKKPWEFCLNWSKCKNN